MKRRTTVFLIAVCAVAAVLAGVYLYRKTPVNTGTPAAPNSGGYPSSPPASSAPAPTIPAAPKVKATSPYKLIGLYFSSLQEGDFPGAYAYLSPDLQKTLTYQAYLAGFHGSRLTGYDSSSLRVVGAGNISLVVQVSYTLSGPAGTATHTVVLRCLNIEPGAANPDWRIESIGH